MNSLLVPAPRSPRSSLRGLQTPAPTAGWRSRAGRRPTAAAALVAVTLLSACGAAPEQGERVAVDAAEECAQRLGISVSDGPPDGIVAASAKPISSGTVIGFAGDAPLVLSYPSQTGTQVAVAVVPASADPTGATTYEQAADPETKSVWFLVPTAKAVALRRCLGGRLA